MPTQRLIATPTEELEELEYPVTGPTLTTLDPGATLVVETFTCTIVSSLPKLGCQAYQVALTDGTLGQLWVGSLGYQREFLSQVQHRMLPSPLAATSIDGVDYLLLALTEGSNLTQAAGWQAEYLQLVQLLKKIHELGWAVLAFHPQAVLLGQPVVLTDLSCLARLDQVPPRAVYLPGYSAPELRPDQPVTGAEDIYLLGAIFYRLVTGEEPPEGGIDLFHPQASILRPGVIQLLGRTLAEAGDRCDFEELLTLVRHWRTVELGQVFRYEVGAATTQGLNLHRTVNEDAWNYRIHAQGTQAGTLGLLIACVADGIGGMAQGEVASTLAAGVFVGSGEPPFFGSDPTPQADWCVQRLLQANRAVYQELQGQGGCTLTGIVLWGRRMTLAHVGDSRAYVVDATGVHQLSTDHSRVQALVNSGLIAPQEALTHEDRNQLLRSVGDLRELPVSYVGTLGDTGSAVSLEMGDQEILLLCSDGVWGVVDLEELYPVIWQCPDLQQAAQGIVERVLAQGAPDNATVLLVRGHSCAQCTIR